MRRRPFLHLTVGALATAGCVGTTGPGASDSTDEPTSSTDGQSTDGTSTDSPDDAGPFTVERATSAPKAIRLNDLGQNPAGGVTQFGDLTDREQSVLTAAVDGGYETDALSDWLVDFASSTRYVERSGTYYELSHTLPTTTITAETTTEAAVQGEIADYEAYEAAVTHDGVVMSGLLRMAREDGGTELVDVWPALEEFLDTYDAVRFHGDLYSVSSSVSDDGPPYSVTAEQVPVSEAVGGSVWNANDEPKAVRDLVREAGQASGAYGFEDAPDGFLSKLDAHEYVFLDGTFYTTYVETSEALPVSIAATVGDEGEGTLTLAVTNDADEPLELMTGAPRPFGVVSAQRAGDSDENHLLWTDAYEENDHVKTEGRDVTMIESIGLMLDLEPGATASETFEVPVSEMPAGEYVVDGSLGVSAAGDASGEESVSGTFRYRVVVSVDQ